MMNLGQSLFALGALTIMGSIGLNANKAILAENSRMNSGESGITAVALAQSLVEEAMGKFFDTGVTGPVNNVSDLTAVNSLGHSGTERYRDGVNDFDDFDDFNDLFLVYKSANPADTARTTGSDWETIVPTLEAKYFVRAKVRYVKVDGSNIPLPDSISTNRTWHKKITVTVMNSTTRDSVVYPAIMSYWN